MTREFNYDIIPQIKERWSPRAFSDKKVPEEELMAILEAARYAPSCFNEQPWRFIIADTPEKHEKVAETLASANKVWAEKAPLLIIILGKKTFTETGENNRWNAFDSGTAWGYLSLEAQNRGLTTHAMGGFSPQKARELFDINDDYEIITVVAIGYMGDKQTLPDDLKEREEPGTRKGVYELILNS